MTCPSFAVQTDDILTEMQREKINKISHHLSKGSKLTSIIFNIKIKYISKSVKCNKFATLSLTKQAA